MTTTSNDAALLPRLASLDAARGLAALSVAWFHFCGSPSMQSVPWLKVLGHYGWAGVEAFFVISGFIVPASFAAFGTNLSDSARFMMRRLIRLYLPFLGALALAVSLNVASSLTPIYRGTGSVLPTGAEWFCNIAYACEFTDHAWIIPVFWSLAIEIQFYLLLMLLVPLTALKSGRWLLAVLLLAMLALAPITPKAVVLHDLPLFACGFFAWLWQAGKVRAGQGALLVSGILLLISQTHGGVAVAGATLTLLLAQFVKRPGPILIWLGTISYSLYLIHIPVGGRVINLAQRVTDSPLGLTLAWLAATIASLVAAYFCWRWLEAPAQRLSRRCFQKSPGLATMRS